MSRDHLKTPKEMAALHALCFTTPRPWNSEEFRVLLESPGVFCCGTRHGFALGRVAGPEAELLTIAVLPEARGSGSGRDLLNRYHLTARDKGCTESFLEVASDNAVAHALYESSGYKLVGKRVGYYGAPTGERLDALVFSRDLN